MSRKRKKNPAGAIRAPNIKTAAGEASSVTDMISRAIGLQQAGRLTQAEAILGQALAWEPENPDALHMLGVVCCRLKKTERAERLIEKAIRLRPLAWMYYNSLGNVHRDMGKLSVAFQNYMAAADKNPDSAEAQYGLGVVSCDQGKWEQALAYYAQAVRLKPDYGDAYNNMGVILSRRRRMNEAAEMFKKALRLHPDSAGLHNNIGNTYKERGDIKKALQHYETAMRLDSGYVEPISNVGVILRDRGALEDAVRHFRKALKIDPEYLEAWNNMGVVYLLMNRLGDAESCFRRILEIKSDHPWGYNNLGNIIKDSGCPEASLPYFKKALECDPEYSDAYSNILLTLHYISGRTPEEIYNEHLGWAEIFEAPLRQKRQPHHNVPNRSRRLKVGYLSPDLRVHSVAFFIDRVLSEHERRDYEIYCFANVRRPDVMTQRLKAKADQWLSICGLSNEEAADLIRSHKIDILVDLAGHTGNNQMQLFALKPAPVQVTWIGYPDTTGLEAMDYRITDSLADPPGKSDRLHTEKLVRLPDCFLCYLPPGDGVPVVNPPSLETNFVTFGSFNNIAKISMEVIRLWAEIIDRVPDSKIVLKSKQLSDSGARQRLEKRLIDSGVAPNRIEIVGDMPLFADHLNAYSRVDIALDPFPYNGTTTTCEALWMGVPVVTLCGDRHSARVGKSLLTTVGLSDLVAKSPQEYVEIACRLAADAGGLRELRNRLREMVAKSALNDACRLVRSLEREYRNMWHQWCENRLKDNETSFVHESFTAQVRRLHIGGTARHPEWEVLNIMEGPHVDHTGNAADLSGFCEETFTELYASHVLEHFDYRAQLPAVLEEWYRVLKPGGRLYVSVPDLETICRLFSTKEKLTAGDRFQLMRMVFGGHVDAHDYHRVGLNYEFMEEYLRQAGFVNIRRVSDLGIFRDTSSLKFKGTAISLNMIAERPAGACARADFGETAA